MLTPKLESLPAELRQLPRWVCWRNEQGRKTPYDAKALNARASSTDPQTWATFEQAETAYLEREGDTDAFTGVGFVLDGDGLAGVDIDHCVTDGKPDPAALALLDNLGAAYVEVSPSGTGLRAFGYADKLEAGCKGKYDGLDVELYSTGRYLTLTGHTLKAGPIAPLRDFQALAERIRADRKVNRDTGEIVEAAPDERHAELVRRILSGDVFHDSLRDLAASLVATGMQPGAVVNHLRGLMDASAAPHDDRWKARRAQIPDLVSSAGAKFEPVDFSALMERAQASNEPRYKLLTAADIAALPPLKWLVRGVLPAEGLAALYGPSRSGKSFLALDLFAAVSEGRRWFDCRVSVAPVVYVCLEGEAGFKVRVQAWERHHGRGLPDGMRVVLQSFKLTEAQDIAELAAAIVAAGGAGAVVVLDTLNRAAPTADENSSRDMGEILEGAKALQGLVGGLVVLVHHSGKDQTRGMRGHSSMFAALDAAIEVTREGDRRAWNIAKSKDGADGVGYPFALEVVPLGEDEYGDPITSCVAVPADPAEAKREKTMTPRQIEGLHSLYRAAIDQGEHQDDRIQIPLEAWRAEFYKTSTADSQPAKKVAFQRVRADLVLLGRVAVEDDVYSIAASDPGLMAAQLLATWNRQKQAADTDGTAERNGT